MFEDLGFDPPCDEFGMPPPRPTKPEHEIKIVPFMEGQAPGQDGLIKFQEFGQGLARGGSRGGSRGSRRAIPGSREHIQGLLAGGEQTP